METLSLYQRQFDYDFWANRRIVSFIEENHAQNNRLLSLLGHYLQAQRIWLARLRGESTKEMPVWPRSSLLQCRETTVELHTDYGTFLRSLSADDLQVPVSYENSRGARFETPVYEILTHVVNHSTYHRAQIATRLKDETGVVPVTDFIAFAREEHP